MGTRGTCGFRVGRKDKLQYNHGDSYPDGLGNDLLKQLRAMSKRGWDSVKAAAKTIRTVDPDSKPTAKDIKKYGHKMNLDVGEQSPEDWYCLLRDLQGDLDGCLGLGVMSDDGGFILESLFCEWGYIVNLDSMKLEVYRGFQSEKHNRGRYAKKIDAKAMAEQKKILSCTYYPCALLVEFDLTKLPTARAFLSTIKKALPAGDEAK